MSDIMRPDYKAGDKQFDDDAEAAQNLIHTFNQGDDAVTTIAASLARQLIYWRHQADTSPTARAYIKARDQRDAALETIASMARTIERLTNERL